MAKGPTHARAAAGTLALGSALSASLALVGTIAWTLAGWAIWGLFCGLLMDGDLDQAQQTASEKRIKERFGPLLGGLWGAFWTPYEKALKHRSFWSHFPVFATALRFLYASVPFILARALFSPWDWVTPLPDYLLWLVWPYSLPGMLALLAGWSAQDVVHGLLDLFAPKPRERRTLWDSVETALKLALVVAALALAAWLWWG